MGAEILLGASAGLSILGGIQSYNSSKAQAVQSRTYAGIQKSEAYRNALQTEEEGVRFAQKQKMLYVSSGVEFGGSAIITIAQTKKWSKAEASAERARGDALGNYRYQTAQNQENAGRSALIGGFAGAAGSVATYGEAKGWYD